DFDAAIQVAREYSHFFPQRFYLELQANGIPEQETLNQKLLELSQYQGLPVVATNDCHYLTSDDVEAHDILLCIQTNAQVDDQKRMRLNTSELYYKSPEEMEREFSHCPEAIENTARIARECNLEIELDKPHFPLFTPSNQNSLEEEFEKAAREGLQERLQKMSYQVDEKQYWDRLEQEINVIRPKGFSGYFLIVQDFINWAKSRDIPVGPGRGSAAGCLVAFALKITNIDPLKYNLLFERFLNIERESLPDIDVDFCYNRREEVIEYVSEKYGKENVAQITTFGTMKAKAVVKDVGRTMGMSFPETDSIAKLIPDDLNITIEEAIEKEPELKQKVDSDPNIAKLMDISKRLQGLARHASTHAAGIVISDKPMQEYLPLYRGKRGELVTQYDMKKVEKVGLIKFDFLGLKTLTVLNDALKLARDNQKKVPDLEDLTLDDEATYNLLGKGQTDGVFQLESSGMRGVLMDLKPSSFEDIIAALALYRPGPLESGMVNDFIQRKHGQIAVEYPHPMLEPVLKETYGVILYQEQVMRIASELANYSLGDGDILRRAMGKKDASAMAEQRTKFLRGCKENGISEDDASYLFDLIEKFAGYGFNKSHSAAYAFISYQTAFMKTHYPSEFMAAILTSEVNNTDKLCNHISACRDMGIRVLKPNINKSRKEFYVQGEDIIFGLAGIKNLGEGAIDSILEEREAHGPFKNLFDFCQRTNMKKVSKRALESLIKSGAMDNFGATRKALFQAVDKVVSKSQKKNREKNKGQLSLLSIVQGEEDTESPAQEGKGGIGIQMEESCDQEWSEQERLRYEQEVLGFFLSGHPLLSHREKLEFFEARSIRDCTALPAEQEIQLGVLLTGKKETVTKKGEKMAFCQAEDTSGTAEIIMFPKTYQKIKDSLDFEQPFLCSAKMANDNDSSQNEEDSKHIKVIAQSITPLAEVKIPEDKPCRLHLNADRIDSDCFRDLKEILHRHQGTNPVHMLLYFQDKVCRLQLGPNYCVHPDSQFFQEIRKWQSGEWQPETRN
ncbi:MAG: DNA polymerase III subunit alpha, partial [Thermodesulfobacteriota bacterium]